MHRKTPKTTDPNFPSSDRQLLLAVAHKDRQAFEELYSRYYRRLYGYLLRWMDRSENLEEVVNDVMFIVWTQAAAFEGRSRVSTWIFGIAYRRAMKSLRTHEKHRATDSLESVEAVDRNPAFRGRELRLSLEKALASLSPEHRTVVELTYFEDCTYQEIAEIVSCPVNTVKTRMFHARKRLREILPRLGFSH